MNSSVRPRILIVDDEPDIRTGLRSLFEATLKAEITEAANGPQALELLAKGNFHAILSDYKMPGMDGLEMLAKAQAIAPRTPRIMMTAYPDLDLALQALNDARILHFFTKPLDPEHAIEILRKVIEAESALRQRDEALRRSVQEMRKKAQRGG